MVAHLALNAEGLARMLHGVVSDEPAAMYDSDEKRDSDIDDLAGAEPSEIRDRLLGGTTVLNDAFAAVPEDAWATRVERTPGGRSMRTASLPSMRLRELEIHHVDLGDRLHHQRLVHDVLDPADRRDDQAARPARAARGAPARRRPDLDPRVRRATPAR